MRSPRIPGVIVLAVFAAAQNQPNPPAVTAAPTTDRSVESGSGHSPKAMSADNEGSTGAMQSMQMRHMEMGLHMKMTALRPLQAGDREKAAAVAHAARTMAEKYEDYRVALADGYQIFLPNLPQKQYHFTNYRNGFTAAFRFDPSLPTSLLYEKRGDGYKLVGVMYTAKKNATDEELNSRIPLSIAQWHAHVNLCMPPPDRRQEAMPPNARFGFAGSIATKEDCEAAGGKFFPQIFGWMLHVYPFEQNPEQIWSVERQHHE
jgi:hypothetical protein